MSMISSSDMRQSYRERNTPGTPDSRRMSANARTHHDSGDKEKDLLTGESLPEDYRVFNFETKDERDKAFAAKLLAGRGKSPGSSLRGGGYTGSSYTINSSHTAHNRSVSMDYFRGQFTGDKASKKSNKLSWIRSSKWQSI